MIWHLEKGFDKVQCLINIVRPEEARWIFTIYYCGLAPLKSYHYQRKNMMNRPHMVRMLDMVFHSKIWLEAQIIQWAMTGDVIRLNSNMDVDWFTIILLQSLANYEIALIASTHILTHFYVRSAGNFKNLLDFCPGKSKMLCIVQIIANTHYKKTRT